MPVTVIDKIKQKNGNFKLMDAADVEMSNGKSVEEAVAEAGSGGIIIGNTSNTSPGDVTQALSEGKTVYINHTSNDFGVVFFTNLAIVTGKLIVAGSVIFENDGELYTARLEGNLSTSEWTFAAEPIAAGIPSFDLGALGMAAIQVTGGAATLSTDTTEIEEAFAKGPFKVVINLIAEGQEMPVDFVLNGASLAGTMYQGCSIFNAGDEVFLLMVQIYQGNITAAFVPFKQALDIPEEKITASVDLSGFENGTVVETYSDGSAKTYTFEFDSDGNPTKITDSDGNETVLTW